MSIVFSIFASEFNILTFHLSFMDGSDNNIQSAVLPRRSEVVGNLDERRRNSFGIPDAAGNLDERERDDHPDTLEELSPDKGGTLPVLGTKDCDCICVWLRIPLYVRDYLATKYYGIPIRLNRLSQGEHLLHKVYDGTRVRVRKSLCYSHHMIRVREAIEALHEKVLNGGDTSMNYIPSLDEVARLTPIALPDTVTRKGMCIELTERWTLPPNVAKELIDVLCNEFWRDLMLYIDDSKIAGRAASKKYRFNLNASIYDFSIGNNIDIRHVDTIERNYRRLKKRLVDEANRRVT